MNHPDWPSFLAAIVAKPDDDTLRLVAADFLEENGEAERAAFIRVQIALASLEIASRRARREGVELPQEAGSLEEDELRRKEATILDPRSAFPAVWAADACPELFVVAPTRTGPGRVHSEERPVQLKWHRGFVERIDCSAVQWFRHGLEVRKWNPVREVILRECRAIPRHEWLAGLDSLSGLGAIWLDLFPANSGDGEFVRWLRGHLPGTEVAG